MENGQGGMENADAAHPSDRYYRYSVCLSICLCVLEKLQIGRAAVVFVALHASLKALKSLQLQKAKDSETQRLG